MKKILVLFCFYTFLIGCSEADDVSYYNEDITVKVTDAISVQMEPNYKLNDYIYLNASFSRYLKEEGYVELLDIFKTTKSEEFIFNFTIQKKFANNTWNTLDLKNAYEVKKGKVSEGYYGGAYAICILDRITNIYEFSAGIPLLETGEYRISHGSQIKNYDYISEFSVCIKNQKSQDPNEEYYYFTVN